MPCTPFPGGIACSRGRRKCASCKERDATRLCDGPPQYGSTETTCSAPLCSVCAKKVMVEGQKIDLCALCWRSRRAALAKPKEASVPKLMIFLAHPRYIGDDEIAALQERTRVAASAALAGMNRPDVLPVVVTGRDDHVARVFQEGGWEGWCASVATGTSYRDGVMGPLYDAIVVAPDRSCGMGVARIVQYALQASKPVYFLEGARLLPVTSLVASNPQNWQRGFEVVVPQMEMSAQNG
jgi:hypothetical protein